MDRFELVIMRLKSGLRQYEVAQLPSVPPTIICDLERGRRKITPEIEERIREAINQVANQKAMKEIGIHQRP